MFKNRTTIRHSNSAALNLIETVFFLHEIKKFEVQYCILSLLLRVLLAYAITLFSVPCFWVRSAPIPVNEASVVNVYGSLSFGYPKTGRPKLLFKLGYLIFALCTPFNFILLIQLIQ